MLWCAPEPLLLASQSAVRRSMLEAAGLPVETVRPDVDERAIEAAAPSADPPQIATLLAEAKARSVAQQFPARAVVAADQTMSCEGRTYHKPSDLAAARRQLMALRGRTHELHSAVAVGMSGSIRFTHVSTARLSMRDFSDGFLDAYLQIAGERVCASVGGYQLEGLGVQLFSAIEGDYFTILGLPLLPLLNHLRGAGYLRD